VTLAEARQAKFVTADTRLLGKLRQTAWEANVLHLTDYYAAP
jgi:predicted nucleic acid-binding protein